MRLIAIISSTLIVLGSQTAAAQEWAPFASVEDGFSATFPGKP